jgi:predicted nucleic acid-binding protein
MNGLCFFDTNILIYADDAASPKKQQVAIALFAEHFRQGSAVLSTQVLQEYFAAATRKLGLPAELAQRKVEIMARCKVVRLEPADVIAAIELHRLGQVSFWDALIVHAARSAGAMVLYTEDLSAGKTFGNLRVVDPFRA